MTLVNLPTGASDGWSAQRARPSSDRFSFLQAMLREDANSRRSADSSTTGRSVYHSAFELGWAPVYLEQQGSFTGRNSMNSALVPSGSKRSSCHFASTPSNGGRSFDEGIQPLCLSFLSNA